MMLIHIILGILKIIGILLLVILCLLLLLLLSLVFVPVRYYGSAYREDGEYEAKVKISWLFHLVFVTGRYGSETEGIQLSIRFLGIPVDVVLKKIAAWSQKRQKKKSKKKSKKKPELTTAEEKKTAVPEKEGTEEQKALLDKGKETAEQAEAVSEQPRSVKQALLETKEQAGQNAKAATVKQKEEPKPKRNPLDKIRRIFAKTAEILKKIFALPGKIKAAFVNFRRTAKEIYGKIKQGKELLSSESFLGVKTLIFGELGTLMGHVRPRKLKGDIYFGFDDPALTGQVLAAASIFYPFYGRGFSLHPYFDRVILEGRAQIWGRMYGVIFVRTVWRLFRDSNVKELRKKFRKDK
ncbi:hypothetical protein [Blautia pseudococcoides]|nr:hypothetical protein [Blautia pseudococcoides]QJU14482.1 hypothetical protein HL650_08460 [Blautia pseudococcoides]QQQ92927.1 hypothetical protein I5Q86_22185 [Blautia pseudococcoides]